MASVSTCFAAVGRLSVRFRWAIVAAWVAGTIAAMVLLPSLSNVTQSDNTSFLPASAPSEQAAQLASPLQGASLTAVTVVAARAGRPLTGADQAAIARLSGGLSRVAKVTSVRDAGQSADGRAEQLTVLAALAQSGGLATSQQASLVADLRDVIRATALPAGQCVRPTGHRGQPEAEYVGRTERKVASWQIRADPEPTARRRARSPTHPACTGSVTSAAG